MLSMENYRKIKGELFQLLLEGHNLLEEDKLFLESIITSLDSQEILGFVRDLKEEGNSLFKQRKFEEALEKYSYAGIILAQYDFVDYNDMFDCLNLAISILLNSAACFGKKDDFAQVGRICTIVLEFEPKNVKALHRRAMASIGLGKCVWAYWDLYTAAELDPKNQEVSTKLQKIKRTLNIDNSNHQSLNDCPMGLGMKLSAPKKTSGKPCQQEVKGVMQTMQTTVSILQTIG